MSATQVHSIDWSNKIGPADNLLFYIINSTRIKLFVTPERQSAIYELPRRVRPGRGLTSPEIRRSRGLAEMKNPRVGKIARISKGLCVNFRRYGAILLSA